MKDIFEKALENCAEEGAWPVSRRVDESRSPADRQSRPTGYRFSPAWKPGFASLVLAVLLTTTAHAAVPKAEAIVTGAEITVGDVFEGAGAHAGRYLAPAPAVGRSKTLDANDLQRISDAFDLGWKPSEGKDHVTVRRETSAVDRYAIEAALQEAIADQMDGQSFDLDLEDKNVSLTLPPKAERTVAASEVRIDLQKNAFTAVLSAPAGAENPTARKQITGRLYALQKVPVLKNPAQKGDLISMTDIDYVDMRASDVPSSVIADADHLVGRTPRRNLGAMKPLGAADIESPTLVKKGDLVTVALQSGTLGLTMQARAMQNGAIGDTVRVVNTASNRQLDGVVTGAQSVSLKLPSAM
jgi:flagella basal body P-ring formation protein FlgA